MQGTQDLLKQYQTRLLSSPTATTGTFPSKSTSVDDEAESIHTFSHSEITGSPSTILLERLPYRYLIQASCPLKEPALLRDLESLTQLRGRSDSNEDDTDLDAEDEPTPPPKHSSSTGKSATDANSTIPPTATEEILYLTDDDIEDA